MNPRDTATARFHPNFNCAQAVFSTFATQMGLDLETALKIAGAFGGGMARAGATCGAVTGALMSIGLKYGPARPGDLQSKEDTYALAQEFMRRFKGLHGSLACRDLLGCDIGIPENRQAAQQQGLYESICEGLVGDAAELVEEILARSQAA